MIPAAYYAPMKSPRDPVPSGDRTMAQNLMMALTAAGVDAQLASEFRSRDGRGDDERQKQLIVEAQREVPGLIDAGREAGWRVWITYHNYYKAPDLIGPEVSAALGIPYVLIEATRARKRLAGPWARFAQAAEAANDAARIIFHLTEHDAEALRDRRPEHQIVTPLRPFLTTRALPAKTSRAGGMLSVGMMRHGDKLGSYEIIAQCLSRLADPDWRLTIVGDGPARPQVMDLMAPFGARVRFAGALPPEALRSVYAEASLLFWPGVNEAFGMTYLEAQAAGVPVLAQDRPGVRDVLAPGAAYPAPDAGVDALADRLEMLLAMPKLVGHLGQSARAHVARHHLLDAAADRLRDTLLEVLG